MIKCFNWEVRYSVSSCQYLTELGTVLLMSRSVWDISWSSVLMPQVTWMSSSPFQLLSKGSLFLFKWQPFYGHKFSNQLLVLLCWSIHGCHVLEWDPSFVPFCKGSLHLLALIITFLALHNFFSQRRWQVVTNVISVSHNCMLSLYLIVHQS